MVDDARLETSPIVWLSPNCCALMPVEPARPAQAQVPDPAAVRPAAPLPRLVRFLKRKSRTEPQPR